MTPTDTPPIGGRYQIGQIVGRGGMATVHRAVDPQLGRAVAVKLMRPDLADDRVFEARFVNEARNAASISHPNVVTVLDFGTDGPGPYIVMELVDGGDLSTLIAHEAPLAPHRAASIAAEVASALQAAHAHGIVHRDVKPGNILIAEDGHPRVADFGIARATGEQSLTSTGSSLGSVDYFSPEQARGEPATAASDIYALGVVLYEMLTGKRPFAGDTQYAVAVARVESPPPDARAVRPDVPKPLADIARRAMATDPHARYPSAAEMGGALTAWIAKHPLPDENDAVAAAPPPAPAVVTPTGKAKAPRASRAKKAPVAAAVAPAAPARARRKATPVAATAAATAAAPVTATDETMPIATPIAASAPAIAPAPTAAAGTATIPVPIAEQVAPASAAAAEVVPPDRRRRGSPLLLAAAAVLLLAVIGFVGGRFLADGDDGTGVIVGEPRGEILGGAAATEDPSEEPTERPTAEPTESASPEATPTPTPIPVAATTPRPAPPAPVTPAPTPIVVAMAITPDQTVRTWYSYVADGQFDAAYALWSERMKANFPREGNLDNRWRDTASVTFNHISVVEQTQTRAVVQVDFVETRDNGSQRRFIGWWELVRSGDGWLLDYPHF